VPRTDTKVLLVCYSNSFHADLISDNLQKRGVPFCRLNTDSILKDSNISYALEENIFSGEIISHYESFVLNDFSSIWWFGVETPSIVSEHTETHIKNWIADETKTCLTSVLSCLPVFFINHPDKIKLASNKIRQLQTALMLGFNIPPTIITSNPSKVRHFRDKVGNIIFKTVSHPKRKCGDEYEVVYTSRVSDQDILNNGNDADIACSLNIFQKEIYKEYEVRATVVGDHVFSTAIFSQQSEMTQVDWRRYDIKNVPHFSKELPHDINDMCLSITKYFGLVYNTIDLILDRNGKWWFLEMNPNGLWAWLELLTGAPISDSITNLLIDHIRM